jgi:2'-5' RNA ligase
VAVRTFLALDIDAAARDRLIAAVGEIDGAGGAKVRWVARQNLHVTLRFLGDVADEALADVCRATCEAARPVDPIPFDVPGLVCVPPGGRQVRMVWAAVREPTGQLARLHERLETALAPLGFRPEGRPFRPHITVGRVKFARDAAALRSAVEAFRAVGFGQQRAGDVVIYGSELTADGPVYTAMGEASLCGG